MTYNEFIQKLQEIIEDWREDDGSPADPHMVQIAQLIDDCTAPDNIRFPLKVGV